MKRVVLLAMLMLAAAEASADVFKCKTPEGTVVYSQSPCADNAQSVNTTAAQPTAADAQNARDQARRDAQNAAASDQARYAPRYYYYPYPTYTQHAPVVPMPNTVPTIPLSGEPMNAPPVGSAPLMPRYVPR